MGRASQDTHRALCLTWNEAVETVPEWPQIRVEVPQYRSWYSLDWGLFPQSLLDELEEYLYFQSGADLLHGSDEPLRPATLKGRRAMLRAYFTAALGQEDPAGLTSFAEALKIERFEKAMLFLQAAAKKPRRATPAKQGTCGEGGRCHSRNRAALAQSGRDKGTSRKAPRSTQAAPQKKGSRGMGEKSRTRVRQFRDGNQVIALAKLPLTLWARLPAIGTPTYAEALLAQKAVAIEVLLRLALRIQNLSDLEIGRHLTWSAMSRVMLIHIPADEVKNDVEITRVIPPNSAAMIQEYIERHRPVLMKVQSNHLFPGTKGGAKQKGHLSTPNLRLRQARDWPQDALSSVPPLRRVHVPRRPSRRLWGNSPRARAQEHQNNDDLLLRWFGGRGRFPPVRRAPGEAAKTWS